MVRPDVSRPRSFRVDLTASVPPSGLFVADFAKAVSLPNSSASVLSECRNVYAMISDSVAELTEAKGVSPDGAVFAVTSPVTAHAVRLEQFGEFRGHVAGGVLGQFRVSGRIIGVGRRRRIGGVLAASINRH